MNLNFSTFTLSNGLTLIVRENHHSQSVVLRGRLEGGANYDPADKAGRALFATGMMRRGSETRSYTQINHTVESLGASLYVNCGRHLTAFGGKCLAEDFETLVGVMADCLLRPTFPDKEIEQLRGHLLTNLQELQDSPRGLAHRYFRQVLYGAEHVYGRPFNGTPETISAISRADLLDFYRRLHPQRGVIVVVGDVQAQAVCDTMEAIVGNWQGSNKSSKAPTVPAPTPLHQSVRHIHPMPSKTQTNVVLGNIGPSRANPDYYAAYLADTILGRLGLGGRIGQTIRDQEGLAYYARTDLSAGLGPTPWYVYAGINPGNVDKTIDLILGELRRMRQTPVLAQELADAKSYLTGVLPLQMETNEGVASTLLEIYLFELGADFIERFPAIMNALTADQVQQAFNKYLNDEVFALAIAGPYHDSPAETSDSGSDGSET